MSVSSTDPITSSTGTGAQVAFDFAFKIFQTTDILVYVETFEGSGAYTLQTLTADYEVAFDSEAETGTVTFVVAPADGFSVIITRQLTVTQGTTLPLEGKMPAKTVEDALDRLTLLVQDVKALFSLPFTPGPYPAAANVIQYSEGTYGEKPATPSAPLIYYSTDVGQTELWLPTAAKWSLIG